MKRNVFSAYRRLLVPFTILGVLSCIYFNGTLTQRTNGSNGQLSGLLSNLTYQFTGYDLNRWIFGDKKQSNAFARYENAYRDYEWRRNYGLVDVYAEQAYYQNLVDVSFQGLYEVQNYQAGIYGDRLSRNADQAIKDNPNAVRYLRTPGAVVGALASLYVGRKLSYRLADELVFESQTLVRDTQNRRVHFGLNGPLFNTALDLVVGGPRAAISRSFASVGMSAGASRGLSDQSTTLSVTKNITESINLSYDHSQSQVTQDNHTVGIGFSKGF